MAAMAHSGRVPGAFRRPGGVVHDAGLATYVQPGIWTADLTWENYHRALTDEYALGVLLVTLKIGAIVTGLCVLLGYPVAYYIARERGRTRHLVLIIVTASLFTNLIVRTYGWMVFLTPRACSTTCFWTSGSSSGR